MTVTLRRTLVLKANTWSSGSQGLVEPLVERSSSLTMTDGYLDQELWQKIVLDFCHSVHLLREMKWLRPVGYRITIVDQLGNEKAEVASWDSGPFTKVPSVSVLSARAMIELIRQADLEGLSGMVGEPA